MTWSSGLLAALALLWPDHAAGPFDGVPLDRTTEAVLVGVMFPTLWWFYPRFLRTRAARILIGLLLFSRIATTALVGQQGLCVRFAPGQPYVIDQTGAPHAWDLRADWRSPDPVCSAVMTRSYEKEAEFPAWFFNLPPPNESWPGPLDRPPGATTRMTVRGYVTVDNPGVLRVESTPDVGAAWSVDGQTATDEAALAAGVHFLSIDATLTGERWRLSPTWNGASLWSELTTIKRPSATDRLLGRWMAWLPALAVLVLLGSWASAAARSTADPWLLAWTAVASAVIGALVVTDRVVAARSMIAALVLAAALPMRARSRNVRGAFLAVGVPWLAYVVACASTAVGRFVLYEVGHDYWMYQRFAYRIAMQGHWIEGGTLTFWFQPFYRWIVAGLHIVFGDSSVGEWFWDGACLTAVALFSFRLARRYAGFRWGIAASVLPLAVFILGTPYYLIGRGLGEISSAGFLAASAMLAMRSRHGRVTPAIAAGLLATLAFFTRLNNLPMALGTAVFAWRRGAWKPATVVIGTIAAGIALLACRSWYFTGSFSPLEGTQRNLLAIWQPGTTLRDGVARTIDSVMMVVSVNDPPRFDLHALPVLIGACTAVAVLAMAPVRRTALLPAAVFFATGIAAAFIARGSAYPGRFSMHILGVTCALSVCAAAAIAAARRHAS